jgi:hypothetical protein
MKRAFEIIVSVFEYIVGGYMIFAGIVTTILDPDQSVTNFMHFLYGTRTGVVVVGLIIAAAGIILLVGKIRRSKKLHGRGLFCTYLCFLFAAVLNYVAYAGDPTVWVSNIIMAAIIAALWLRWKMLTNYLNPKQFRKTAERYRTDLP